MVRSRACRSATPEKLLELPTDAPPFYSTNDALEIRAIGFLNNQLREHTDLDRFTAHGNLRKHHRPTKILRLNFCDRVLRVAIDRSRASLRCCRTFSCLSFASSAAIRSRSVTLDTSFPPQMTPVDRRSIPSCATDRH